MISAGESSGELYGAMLSREIRQLWPDTEIFGIGGSRMKAEGVELIAPVTHIIGIVEVIKHLPGIIKTYNKAKEALFNQRPDVLVLIDYPDFNITLARKAKAAGVPVLYYVSPQVWAWRSGRVKKIAAVVDRMAVLFPFELACYEKTGLPCEFVGHPIAENIDFDQSKEELKKSLGLDPQKGVVTLLPGSRPNEIFKHQTIIREVAEKIHNEYPDMQIVVPLVKGSSLTETFPDYVEVIYGRTTEAVACSEAAAVTSGTATLETALLGIPMVVFYKISPVTFYIGRILTNLKHISLANILLDRKVLLELVQEDANSDNIFAEVKRILNDRTYREKMQASMKEIRDAMEGKKPSARVASIIGEITGWSRA
jgi:lipid-A-disaccharide synthase